MLLEHVVDLYWFVLHSADGDLSVITHYWIMHDYASIMFMHVNELINYRFSQ